MCICKFCCLFHIGVFHFLCFVQLSFVCICSYLSFFLPFGIVDFRQMIPAENGAVCPGGKLQYICMALVEVQWEIDGSSPFIFTESMEVNSTEAIDNFSLVLMKKPQQALESRSLLLRPMIWLHLTVMVSKSRAIQEPHMIPSIFELQVQLFCNRWKTFQAKVDCV